MAALVTTMGPEMIAETLEALATALVERFNSADVDGMTELFHPDAVQVHWRPGLAA